MAVSSAPAVADPEAIERACALVRRYLNDALFGGDEQVLADTVADPVLQERAWLFWAAFTDRSIDDVDVLFGNADGSRVACYLSASAVQIGPWITSASVPAGGRMAMLECTAIYTVSGGRITNFRETWR